MEWSELRVQQGRGQDPFGQQGQETVNGVNYQIGSHIETCPCSGQYSVLSLWKIELSHGFSCIIVALGVCT